MRLIEIEKWIHRDPAGRGFLAEFPAANRPCADHLRLAGEDLAAEARSVGIVTGFYVPDAPTPAAETDGPIGAILLADVLQSTGWDVCLITDELCSAAIRAAVNACGAELELMACPVCSRASAAWHESFWSDPRQQSLTHLVSVERVGPTMASAPGQDQCRNMRDTPIDDWSADLYRLFEQRPSHIRTIGIGDGGNEIGMGGYWQQVGDTRPPPPNACRTITDRTVLAGVSDWGAMALAAAVCMHRADFAPLQSWGSARIEHGLSRMVADGPAIDGCTFRPEPTVDGLPFATYIQPWEHIRRTLGLDS